MICKFSNKKVGLDCVWVGCAIVVRGGRFERLTCAVYALGAGGLGAVRSQTFAKTFCFDFRQYLERLTSALGCQTVVKHLFKSFSFEENGYF